MIGSGLLEQAPPARGWLRNGNPPGDFRNCARCGAKTRAGNPCNSPAMKNGRCRMHGGASTGPRTEAGLEQCRQANRKTGQHSKFENNYGRMLLDLTQCVRLSGEILKAKMNELVGSEPGQGQIRRRDPSKLMEKAERLLHRVWTFKPFLAFARNHDRKMYRAYLVYCRRVGHPVPSGARSQIEPPVEGHDSSEVTGGFADGIRRVPVNR